MVDKGIQRPELKRKAYILHGAGEHPQTPAALCQPGLRGYKEAQDYKGKRKWSS